jgi:multicomponent Na+:H+ antiporter subunit D
MAPAICGVNRTTSQAAVASFTLLGMATAVIGGAMALRQRHLKRLLAFSHIGVMLVGFAALTRDGLAGMGTYRLGHGLVKDALFMVAGILLATQACIDEVGLRGLGRGVWPAGIAMALGGLLLAGLPVGLMDKGTELIDAGATEAERGWCVAGMVFGAALTGAAVLRATGRIFLGWGPFRARRRGRRARRSRRRPTARSG